MGKNRLNPFHIFAEAPLQVHFSRQLAMLRGVIESQSEDYILNVNENEYLNHLVSIYTLDSPIIDVDRQQISSSEAEGDVDFQIGIRPANEGHRTRKRHAILCHVPFTGDPELLRLMPSARLIWEMPVTLEDGHINFEVPNRQDDQTQIKQEKDRLLSNLTQQAAYLANEVKTFNDTLPAETKGLFFARKQRLLDKNSLLASLDVPIKRSSETPETFAIPAPQMPKRIVIKPEVTESGYTLVPTLDPSIYRDILRVIFDVGKGLERYPSSYMEKTEPELRDYFLLLLQPNFSLSATAETFNKKGKTDILLRWENSNVFVAECTYWEGVSAYDKKLSQLFGYLTWRESKAAVVIFVRNKNISQIVGKVREATAKHRNYVDSVNEPTEGWLNFRFHIDNDPNREVALAVLVFHLPTETP